MHIEAIEIQNYRALRSVSLSKMPRCAVFIGANGSGKSTLFDVFAFLADALKDNIQVALQKRGGLRELLSRGATGPIVVQIKYRDRPSGPLAAYRLEVGERAGRGVVLREQLSARRGQHGKPWMFLDFSMGAGVAIRGGGGDLAAAQREEQALDSPDILALKGLGQFQRFPMASALRRLIEAWHLSDFHVQAARPSQEAGYAEHLSTDGANLALVTQFLFDRHPAQFAQILDRMARRVPGVSKVEAAETVDGRVVLRFQDGAFKDPFISRYVSDGTIKMFAYLVLLYDPKPHPLVCIEEPENQLYPTLLGELAEEFDAYAERGGQVMVSTHSPELLNACRLDQIYTLSKRDGATAVRRASDDAQLAALVAEGDLPGALWKQGAFEGLNP